jgi:hypothetical protein
MVAKDGAKEMFCCRIAKAAVLSNFLKADVTGVMEVVYIVWSMASSAEVKNGGSMRPFRAAAISEAVSRWLPTAASRVSQVGFVVDKVASG